MRPWRWIVATKKKCLKFRILDLWEGSEAPLSESKTTLPDDSTLCYNIDTEFRFSETFSGMGQLR